MAEKTKEASVKASSASAVTLTTPGWPRTPAISTASLAVVCLRNGSGSNRLISSNMLAPPDSKARTKAGMRTPPPPNIANFTSKLLCSNDSYPWLNDCHPWINDWHPWLNDWHLYSNDWHLAHRAQPGH